MNFFTDQFKLTNKIKEFYTVQFVVFTRDCSWQQRKGTKSNFPPCSHFSARHHHHIGSLTCTFRPFRQVHTLDKTPCVPERAIRHIQAIVTTKRSSLPRPRTAQKKQLQRDLSICFTSTLTCLPLSIYVLTGRFHPFTTTDELEAWSRAVVDASLPAGLQKSQTFGNDRYVRLSRSTSPLPGATRSRQPLNSEQTRTQVAMLHCRPACNSQN